MYARCGSILDSQQVFDGMLQLDAVAWNSLIQGYAGNGQISTALEIFSCMIRDGTSSPTSRTIVAALKASSRLQETEETRLDLAKVSSLERCRRLHSLASVHKMEVKSVFVANTLIDVYIKCGSLLDARRVFDCMDHRDTISWNIFIVGYLDHGDETQALALFEEMLRRRCMPNSRSFVAAIKACSKLAAKEEPKFIGGKLIKIQTLEKLMSIHRQAAAFRLELDLVVASALIDLYSECGSILGGQRIFDAMPRKDTVACNTMILGFAENEKPDLALELFSSMHRHGFDPNARSFVAVLKACIFLAEREVKSENSGYKIKALSLERCMALHAETRLGTARTEANTFLSSSFIDLYSKCGSLVDSLKIFETMPQRDATSWTALITGCVENEEHELALELFSQMQSYGDCKPDARSFVAAIKACSSSAAEVREDNTKVLVCLERGMALHLEALRRNYLSDKFVSSALVEMYVRCSSLEDAIRVFEEIQRPGLATWNLLMMGYIEAGEGDLGLECFERMKSRAQEPNASTFLYALKACELDRRLEAGRGIHSEICRSGLETNAVLATSLIDFYGKCGYLTHSRLIFDAASTKDSVTWNVLLAGYSSRGDYTNALHLFYAMGDEGVARTSISFVSLLNACSHVGLVDTARKIFQAMERKYNITPGTQHCGCMVDILCRSNHLDDAMSLVRSMPLEANAVAWTIILNESWKRNNMVTGKLAFESLQRLNATPSSSAYTLMARTFEVGT